MAMNDIKLDTERSRSMGSYFRLPLPIFFADVFSSVEPDDHAKKDFRSSRAADSTQNEQSI